MRITVSLHESEFQQLQRVAFAERRPVRDQAAVLIERGLIASAPARPTGFTPAEQAAVGDER